MNLEGQSSSPCSFLDAFPAANVVDQLCSDLHREGIVDPLKIEQARQRHLDDIAELAGWNNKLS
ncbi:MAG: hypothetical protein WCX61_03810 [Candidatus Peribacteraceae bacterium]|jgi:hypothetical protein